MVQIQQYAEIFDDSKISKVLDNILIEKYEKTTILGIVKRDATPNTY